MRTRERWGSRYQCYYMVSSSIGRASIRSFQACWSNSDRYLGARAAAFALNSVCAAEGSREFPLKHSESFLEVVAVWR